MATTAYRNWAADGRPWKVAAPVRQLGDILKGYGYTVYYLGADDGSHLQASKPEDHCPFSFTGWPVTHPYPYVTALDIMPPPRSSGLPSLQQIGATIYGWRVAGDPGLAWLKYMNWEPDRDNGGRCWHDSWQPNFNRRDSSDRGHIHMSGRSDMVSSAGPAFDPVDRIRNSQGADMPLSNEDVQKIWTWDLVDGPNVGMAYRLVNQLVADVAELKARPAGTVVLTEDDRAALIAGFEAAAEHAVRRVLGAIDGATPQ